MTPPQSKQKTPMQLQISSLIQAFKHDSFATITDTDISDLVVNEQGNTLNIQLTLPYAAKSIEKSLQQYLAQQLPDHQINITVDIQLLSAPCFKQVGNIVLVASGKGGVGKSTTAVNLALALCQEGAKVGLLDADVYGPSIPLMLGMQGQKPTSIDGKIMEPLIDHGVKVNSIGFLINPEDAAVWRGPMASSALSQLIGETNWGELDYLVVDMPPGTGDIQLTISQKFPCTGAVVVTTPQNIALADAQKGVAMFNKVNIPVLGIIENMSYFQCSACGAVEHIFGADGAIEMAQQHGTVLLGQIPLVKQNRENSDNGTPTVTTDSPLAALYKHIARKVSKQLYVSQQNATNVGGPEISFIDD